MKLLKSDKKHLKNKIIPFRCTEQEKAYIMNLCKLIAKENELKNANFSTCIRFLMDQYEPNFFKEDINLI